MVTIILVAFQPKRHGMPHETGSGKVTNSDFNVKEAQPQKVNVVFVHIGATSLLENLRQYFPEFLLKKLPLLTVQIRISPPQKFPTQTLSRLSPAELTTFLKQEYDRLLL